MRKSEIKRKTAETDISMCLSLDGRGESNISTGCGYIDHMLTLFARHGRFDLEVTCRGDLRVDGHHTTEDLGITLGKCFYECLGDKRGITRYGEVAIPMDESLILCSVDISGRPYLNFDVCIPTQKVGNFDTELVEEFFLGFVRNAGVTLHFAELAGKNSHHIIECCFKAFGRTMAKAVKIDEDFKDEIMSTKGVL